MKIQFVKYIAFMAYMFITMFSSNTFCQNWENTTIYTPNESEVSALRLISGDLSQTEKNQLKNNWLDYYDNRITFLAEATWKYNCHSYAWHVSEGGNIVWINSPGDDT